MSPSESSIRISAPGKVILHGEHSVVYGKLALAASLGLRTRLEFREVESLGDCGVLEFADLDLVQEFHLQDLQNLFEQPLPLKDLPSNYNITHPELINQEEFHATVKKFLNEKIKIIQNFKQLQALAAFLSLFWGILNTVEVKLKPFKLKLTTDLTISAGTGSSASFSVTLSAFLIQFLKIKQLQTKKKYKSYEFTSKKLDSFDKEELELISKWAFQGEKIIHGTPSGVDNTVCTYGSMVEFYKGVTPKLVELTSKFNLILINTNIPRDTKVLIEKVVTLRSKYQSMVDGILALMDETALNALDCIKKINSCTGDEATILKYYETLGELTDINQNLLRCLTVSHPKLEEACQILSEKGLHGKLTGAGGGGFAICLVPPNYQRTTIDKVISQLNSKGFSAILTDLGGKGVTIDRY